ncbi:MAG: hypothetical protein B6I26_04790 [Desulfobacteraceae bacterium 4572_130]|nr:MAG: hypothetical protein B6I26_04790 [Desulfobacteraceae bacterium 4572_130]
MGYQILIVDNDRSYAQALVAYLERHQFQVIIASTMDEFSNYIEKNEFDILLSDITLGKTDISGILKEIKISNKLIEIIILVDSSSLDSAMDKINKNALAYLEKPVNKKSLDHNIAKALTMISLNKKLGKYSQKLADLHKAQNIFQDLFDQVPSYISVQDKNLRITASNKKFQRDFGNELGRYCYEQYKHRTSPCIKCPVKSTFANGKSYNTEEIVTSKLGKQYNVLTQTAPIYNDDNEITQVMEISTNITQIRELQDHLSSLGMMIGSMSHGVKGMLTALDGGIYQLETGIEKNDMKRIIRAFHNTSEMSNKIKKMVLEILYYAKSRKLQYQTLDGFELIQSILSTVNPLAESKRVKIKLSISPSLGNLEIDPTWFQAALAQEKLFTMFFTSKGSKGTGLGLFIAHRVIENHGGTISINSKLGKGSTFQIYMPRVKPSNINILDFPDNN